MDRAATLIQAGIIGQDTVAVVGTALAILAALAFGVAAEAARVWWRERRTRRIAAARVAQYRKAA